MENNLIETRSIGTLLDGKTHFFIPCYQRGYRWTHKQVDDLLGDLYTFKKRHTNEDSNFYCLQPVIVREITDTNLRHDVLGEQANDPEQRLWELVDGQQRLTTIYILLRFLLNKEHVSAEEFLEDYNASLFDLSYESRPSSRELLRHLDGQEEEFTDIDATHILNAYHYISLWFSTEGKGAELSKQLYGGESENPKKLRQAILDLLVPGATDKTVKVIWYQLDNSDDTDPIQEFVRINNGKIPLTDTELVKALFLQKRNYDKGEDKLQQVKVSMQWEEMENMLQVNDFWCFISRQDTDAEDRMSELLRLVYLKHSHAKASEIEAGDVFRYYYGLLDGLGQTDIQTTVSRLWTELVDTFHTLQDWYEDPETYNYVGFLVQSGRSLTDLYQKYEANNASASPTSFISLLEEDIRLLMRDIKIEEEEEASGNKTVTILTEYQERPKVRKILLLLNVELLSSQLRKLREANEDTLATDAKVFRFPFDLYKSQQWDIEHVDSATTNTMQKADDQEDWVLCAIKEIWPEENVPEDVVELQTKHKWSDLIQLIQKTQNEEEDNKNFIGNLTLLDSATNRSYGNHLFCRKRKIIIEKVKQGLYVLPCTQYVFLKFFDDSVSGTNRAKWTATDKQRYHDYIVELLFKYLPITQSQDHHGE